MARAKQNLYWSLLLVLILLGSIVLTVGQTQARYTDTTILNTVILKQDSALTSNCLRSDVQQIILLGQMTAGQSVQVKYTLEAHEDVSDNLVWYASDGSLIGVGMELTMTEGEGTLTSAGVLDMKAGSKAEVTMTLTGLTNVEYNQRVDVQVICENLLGIFRVMIVPGMAEEETTVPSEGETGNTTAPSGEATTDPTESTGEEATENTGETTAPGEGETEENSEGTEATEATGATGSAEGGGNGEEETTAPIETGTVEETPVDSGEDSSTGESDTAAISGGLTFRLNALNDMQIMTETEEETGTTDDSEPVTEENEETNTPPEGETTDPGEGETTAPSEDETTAPSEGETTDPSESETTDPSESETTDPSESETTAPSESETTDPSEGETTDPSEGETTAPSEGETTDPSEGETTAPSEEETTDPTEDTEVAAGILMKSLTEFEVTSMLPVRLLISGDVDRVELGVNWLNAFPAFTRYSLDGGETYYMLYFGGLIELDGGFEGLIPGDVAYRTVLIDFSGTSLSTEAEMTLGAQAYLEDQVTGNSSIKVQPVEGTTQTEEIRILTKPAALETPAMVLDENATEETLDENSSFVIHFPVGWNECQLDYQMEILCADEAGMRYEPVTLDVNSLYAELSYLERMMTVRMGSNLPPAGTYRLTINCTYEGICIEQRQITFFINYSTSSDTQSKEVPDND